VHNYDHKATDSHHTDVCGAALAGVRLEACEDRLRHTLCAKPANIMKATEASKPANIMKARGVKACKYHESKRRRSLHIS
jgi:hypothetical protein